MGRFGRCFGFRDRVSWPPLALVAELNGGAVRGQRDGSAAYMPPMSPYFFTSAKRRGTATLTARQLAERAEASPRKLHRQVHDGHDSRAAGAAVPPFTDVSSSRRPCAQKPGVELEMAKTWRMRAWYRNSWRRGRRWMRPVLAANSRGRMTNPRF